MLLPVLPALAACGGSSSSSSAGPGPGPTTAIASTATSASASGTAKPASPGTTTGSSSSSSSSGSGTPATTTPTGGASPYSGGASSGGGSVNARVPALFKIRRDGALSPTSVSAPAFLALQISIESADAKGHQIVLRTPTAHALTVSARGHASLLVPGLRAGTYAIDVDGAPKATLIIGGEPGP